VKTRSGTDSILKAGLCRTRPGTYRHCSTRLRGLFIRSSLCGKTTCRKDPFRSRARDTQVSWTSSSHRSQCTKSKIKLRIDCAYRRSVGRWRHSLSDLFDALGTFCVSDCAKMSYVGRLGEVQVILLMRIL
jgi:hypothetical protein